MRSKLRLRSIFWLRKYSKQDVYMHSSDGNISVYVLISAFWISQRLLLEEVSWHHDEGCQVFPQHVLILSEEMNNSCCLVFRVEFLRAIRWQHLLSFTCSTMEDENPGKWQVETHARTNRRKPGHVSQTVPNAKFMCLHVPIIRVRPNISTCLNGVKVRINCCLHGKVLLGLWS